MKKILVIEDDEGIHDIIKHILEGQYDLEYITKGSIALNRLKEENYELIILDIGLPDINGYEICNIVKTVPAQYGSPFIMMLTAKEDVVKGLEIGADDYLKKPFDFKEFKARVDALLRRKESLESESDEIKYKTLIIDKKKMVVMEKAKKIELTSNEFNLIYHFLENKGMVLTRGMILDKIWKDKFEVSDRIVDVNISNLRKKSEILSSSIRTIKGIGYKLEE